MRITHILLAGCAIAAGIIIGNGSIAAQIRRRPAVSRAPVAGRPLQQRGIVGNPMLQEPGDGGPLTPEPGIPDPGRSEPLPPAEQAPTASKTLTLSAHVPPANGPESAQGTATINHTAEGILLDTGLIALSGLPVGTYDAWAVFSDPSVGEALFSQLVARLTIAQESEPVEAAMLFGTLVGREFALLEQIVITAGSDMSVEVGGEPVSGAAGQIGGPGADTAQLAANAQVSVDDASEPQRAAPPQPVGRRMLPSQRSRLRSMR